MQNIQKIQTEKMGKNKDKRGIKINFIQILFFFFSLFLFFTFSSEKSFAKSTEATLFFQECHDSNCTDVTKNTLSGSYKKGDMISLRIMANNPENAPIYSVQSWIKYNSTIFSVSRLFDDTSEFPLAAPGEFKALNDKGEIRIGRAVTGTSITKKEIIVADIQLEVKKNVNGAQLQFIDFISDDIGKTALITIENNVPANIINNKPSSLIFQSVKSAPKVYTKPKNLEETQNGENVYGIENSTNNSQNSNTTSSVENIKELPRPQGFRSRTYENGRVEHIWKQGEDSRIKGYYIYYSTTSGKYMHRRDLGKTNIYKFKNDFFAKGKRIYFAIQAYTQDGTLSDFSDETYVVIGTEGSESHPFFEQIFPDAKQTGQDENFTYYGAEITSDEKNKNISGNNKNYATPKRSPQSGLDIPFHWFLLMGGIIMFFGGRMILKKD